MRPWTFLWSTWGDSPQPSHAQTRRCNSIRRRGGGEAFSRNDVHGGGRPAAVREVRTFVHTMSTGLSKPNLLGVKVLQKCGHRKDDKNQLRLAREGQNGNNYGLIPNYIRVKASAKCSSSNLGAKPRGREKFVPGVGDKPYICTETEKTISLTSSAPLQQLERVGSGKGKPTIPPAHYCRARTRRRQGHQFLFL